VRLAAEKLAGPEFYLEANGATRVTLSGTLNAISATMNGASRLNAEDLRTRAAELSINGAGRADVNASEVLRVAVSGAGRVNYSGNPQVSQEISGAGRVRRRE
jgi:carbon monoxide dehydrogenase subunit G